LSAWAHNQRVKEVNGHRFVRVGPLRNERGKHGLCRDKWGCTRCYVMWKARGDKEPKCQGKPGRRLTFWGRRTDPQGTEYVVKHAEAVDVERKFAEMWGQSLCTKAK
jgi:hypothetical protein